MFTYAVGFDGVISTHIYIDGMNIHTNNTIECNLCITHPLLLLQSEKGGNIITDKRRLPPPVHPVASAIKKGKVIVYIWIHAEEGVRQGGAPLLLELDMVTLMQTTMQQH
jgi:hypothetical protein